MSEPSRRILIVEDDPDFGFYIQELVRGAEVGEPSLVDDGLKALQTCLENPPDLVILDLDLPSLRGEELCRMLRSSPQHRGIPILVCSEMPEAQRKEMEMLQIGANGYVEKPFVEEAFLQSVSELLRTPKSVTPNGEIARSQAGGDAPTGPYTRPGGGGAAFRPAPRKLPDAALESFEGFRLHYVIGAGGMGTVYKATQLRLNREVALKVFLRSQNDSPEVVERFRREALIMARFNHPNIVSIIDAGNTGYTFYIAMEFVTAGSLQSRIREKSLSWPQTVAIIRQTFDALAYLHSNDLIHRDIKPANILISEHGAAKLADFGISSARLGWGDEKRLTKQNAILGTAMYMAPELMLGLPANERTDQYALGRTLFALFQGSETDTFNMHLADVRSDLPRSLCEAVDRCVHIDMDQRFPTLEEARDAVLAGCDQFRA